MAVTPIRGSKFGRNKINALTLVQIFMVDTLEECDTVAPEGYLYGIPEDERNAVQEEGGKGRYEVTITYRGAKDDTPQGKERWSGKVVLREEPIISAPNIQDLLEKYQGTPRKENGKTIIDWPEFLSGGGSGSGLGSGTAKTPNPMFGAKTYPVMEGEVQVTYLNKLFPPDFYNYVGKVLPRLPSGSGIPTPSGYVWVTMTPEFEGHGPESWVLKQNYRLTRKQSYTALIWKLIQRGGGSGGSPSLSSPGIQSSPSLS